MSKPMSRSFSSLLLLSFLLSPGAVPASETPADDDGWTVLETRPADGEQCLVCRQAIHDGEIVELRYRGRRFHVAASMLDEFEADPEDFFNSLQARSALFDEAAMEAPPMSNGWLYFGLYVLVGLIAAALCGYLAIGRGQPAIRWFLAGLIFNVAALIFLLVAPRGDLSRLPEGVPDGLTKVPTTRKPTACPTCGTANHPAAARCTGCDRELRPSVEAETARV